MRNLMLCVGILLGCAGCSSPEKPSASSAAGTGGANAGSSPGAAGTSGGALVGGGSGGSASGSSGAGAGGMAPAPCNEVELDATDYVLSFAAGSPAEPKGGTIEDGTYFFSRLVTYGFAGPDTVAGRGKIVLKGADWEAIEDNDAAADNDINPSKSWSATLATSGTQFTLTQTCPSPDSVVGGYTAEGDTLTLYITDGGVKFAEELKRQ